MQILFMILIFTCTFAIYDLVRNINKTLVKQTHIIKKLKEEIEELRKN